MNAKQNRADVIRAGMKSGGGVQEMRELYADKQLQLSARAEVGKLGIAFNLDAEPNTRSEMLEHRAELRRVVNQVKATVNPKDPKTLTDDVVNTVEWLSNKISLISNELDLQESGSCASRGSESVRDVDGRRIGTSLNASTLRDESKVADALKAHGGDPEINLGSFVRGVSGMRSPEGVRAALSTGTDSAGGFTLPSTVLPGILAALVPTSSLLSAGAGIVVLEDGAKSFSIAAVNSVPTATWRNESAVVAESDPVFRSVAIVPRSLSFYFRLSRELLADSQDLEQALRIAIAGGIARAMDLAGLRGTGVAPVPRGLLNTAGVQAVGNGANGAALSGYSSFIGALSAIKSADGPDPTAAIMAPRSFAKLAGLVDTQGQPVRKPGALESWNLIQTSQVPVNLTVGTSTDCSEIYVGDFRNMAFYLRDGISIQLADQTHASTGELAFYVHARVDVGVHYPAAFAVVTGVRA